jgi:alkyldihydroxyacetonephosphate synthase
MDVAVQDLTLVAVQDLTPRMRWWGWGVDGHDPELSPGLISLLRDELRIGGPGADWQPVALEEVELAAPAAVPLAVRDLVPTRDDRLARVSHAAGRSYPDLVRLRSGRGLSAPDAVLYPGSHDEVLAVLQACTEHAVAVVAFGGGTSVVGGVEPLRGRFRAVVALDLSRLDGLVAADPEARTATLQAGVFGPDVERLLGERGLTLGHFPQSFEFSTVGGWVATRSAGQASTGYGRIDDMVLGLKAATPLGTVQTLAVPATAAGPDLRQLLAGSEGTLGVITEVTLRVRARPRAHRVEAFALPSFAAGRAAFRELAQAGATPDVARLSDEDETRLSLTLAGDGATAGALRGYLRARGRSCLVIAGFDGDSEADVRARRTRTAKILRRHGAIALGRAPGAAWEAGRFNGPYLRDVLMGHGVLVDTLETAATWDRIPVLYAAVGEALRGALGRAFVMCHVSHVYETGCSLYFTFAAAQERDRPLEQWRAAKSAASDAILAAGGTITHHHGVGRDHAPWLAREIGTLGSELLRAAKERLDPAGIMNPGKLLA